MAVAGLYRRILPSPPAIEFASSEGKARSSNVWRCFYDDEDQKLYEESAICLMLLAHFIEIAQDYFRELFSEALANGTMEGFFKLISYFQTQSEPAYCGLATLAVVLNALGIDPGRKWKGPWRFFDESMLDCCEPLEKVKAEGITFGKVACLAQCAGAKVEAFRTNQTTLGDFRRHVINCASSEECHLITSYHRGTFKQTGTGHFSPIGGYHSGRDMALILDVARFKYPPHWVPVPLLWEAMDTIDAATGCPRGFMLVSKLHNGPALLYTLSCKHESWIGIARYLLNDVPHLLKSDDINTVEKVLSVIFAFLPSNVADFIRWTAEVRRQEEGSTKLSKEEKERLAIKATVLRQMHEMDLFKCVVAWLSSESPCCQKLLSTLRGNEDLPKIASSICCEGAELLTGGLVSGDGFCCNETSLSFVPSNGDDPSTVLSGKVTTSNSERGIMEVLVPTAHRRSHACCKSGQNDCVRAYPASTDVLTALLLALPPHTWNSLKDSDVHTRINDMVCVENLPLILQEEVLHLRRQLVLLQRCKDKKVDDELGEPSQYS